MASVYNCEVLGERSEWLLWALFDLRGGDKGEV